MTTGPMCNLPTILLIKRTVYDLQFISNTCTVKRNSIILNTKVGQLRD